MLKIGHFRLEKIYLFPKALIAYCKEKRNTLLYISIFFVRCLFTRGYDYRVSYLTPLRAITASVEKKDISDFNLILELNFGERQSTDYNVVPHLVVSVNCWL